ncbi:MAG: hypothetical protein SOH58_06290 [Olsenella sp.]
MAEQGDPQEQVPHGRTPGACQPAAGEKDLGTAGVPAASVERACWLVAHHHTYVGIDDVDHRVLVEADFLVNAYEDAPEDPAARSRVASQVAERVFRTRTGLALLRSMYLSDAYAPLP